MRIVPATILALALAASGTASAQWPSGSGAYDPPDARYGDQYESRYRGQDAGGVQYDVARVVRVDPVIDDGDGGYGSDRYGNGVTGGDPTDRRMGDARQCVTRQDSYASDGYGGYGDDRGYQDPYRQGGYGNDGYRNGQVDGYGRQVSTGGAGGTIATVVGGVVGAVLGSQVGGGSGRYATSAIGTMVGGLAGREIYEASQRNRYPQQGTVTVCDPLPSSAGGRYASGVNAYDVTYEYAGRRYTTRTAYHPGDTIRVRVDVRPE